MTKFLAFGDSMTAGEVTVPTSTATSRGQAANFTLVVVPTAAYPTRLQTSLRATYVAQASSVQVTNSGVPSEWSQDGARRLPTVLAASDAQVLLLMEGINDLAALGDGGMTSATAGLESMVRIGTARGVRVFIATIPPPRAGGPRAINQKLVTALNDRIRAAAALGAVVVDVNAALSTDVARFIGMDGLHPTEEGYDRIAQTFFDSIRRELETK